jgi:spore germination protein KC
MTKRAARASALLLLVLPLLAGCWDKTELTNWGFVQAAAIDRTQGGRIRLMTQIYKPGNTESQTMAAAKGGAFLNLTSDADTVSEAARQISSRLGRRLQWSHMRALLIGEDFAQSRSIDDALDYFSRSQGPRGSTSVFIAAGEASSFLQIQPLIESTIGQQLKTVEQLTSYQVGTAARLTLLDLSILARTAAPATDLIPRIELSSEKPTLASISGLAVARFPEGKMTDTIPLSLSPYILMLRNQFKGGVINLPCRGQSGEADGRSDAFMVTQTLSKVRLSSRAGRPVIRIHLKLKGKPGEFNCSRVLTEKENRKFLDRLQKEVESKLGESMSLIQARKEDVIHAGEYAQRWHPRLWKRWSGDWENIFSRSRFEAKVRITMTDTGMDTGEPFAAPPSPAKPK